MTQEIIANCGDKKPKETKKKVYSKPAIIHEQELETKAGSPVNKNFDPLKLDNND